MNTEEKRKKIERWVKVIGAAAVCFFVSPIIFVTIKGALGVILAGIIGVIVVNFVPVFSRMVANWKLKAIKAEANRNPVETLQNDYLSKESKLSDFRSSVVTFRGKIGTFADKLNKFDDKHPEEATKFREILKKMKSLLSIRENKLYQAQQDLAKYAEEIVKAGEIWEMAQAANDMTEAAGSMEDDFIARIAAQTAINSIQDNLNTAFAELEQSLLDEQSLVQGGKQPPALPKANSDVIITISEPEKIKTR